MCSSANDNNEITFSVLIIVDVNKIQGKLLFKLPADMGVGKSFWRALTSFLIVGRKHLWAALVSLEN